MGIIVLEFLNHKPVDIEKDPKKGDHTVTPANKGYVTWSTSWGLPDSTVFIDQMDPDKVYYVVGHEIGHSFWLIHAENTGESNGPHHDKKDHNCIMSYSEGLVVYRQDGSTLLRMDGLTGQKMISGARVDVRPFKDTLAAGAEWKWNMDLSTLHYPLPAGNYYLEARLDDEGLGVILRSDATEIQVEDPDLIHMAPSRANPVMDGLALLFRSPTKNGVDAPLVLRQYNALRPLAAWYSSSLPSDLRADLAFCAQPAFFQTDSFDPFFRKWVIGSDGANLSSPGVSYTGTWIGRAG
ncbi:MAG: hypothetical protein M3Y08_07255 [Fibrobacterota bacterium]|nr:hypothetical protein [Fibrobacterota bacterium]